MLGVPARKPYVGVNFTMAPEEVCSVIFFETAKGIVSGSYRLPTQGLTAMAGSMTSQMLSL